MIAVKVSKDNFVYDVHSLVKAFYPGEDVKVFVQGEKDIKSDNGLEIEIVYGDDSSKIRIYEVEEDNVKRILAVSMTSDKASYANRADYKNCLKQVIYKSLSQYTGKELPWGTLTGIRPTKILLM